jgi:hypothetical protein
MSAATIPLMGVSPLGAYSQMLNLGALQQDQQQQRQMAPYKLQEAQNQTQLQQQQLQQQQFQADMQAAEAKATKAASVPATDGQTATAPATTTTAPTPQTLPYSVPAGGPPPPQTLPYNGAPNVQQNLTALQSSPAAAPAPTGQTMPLAAMSSASSAPGMFTPANPVDDSANGQFTPANPVDQSKPAPAASAAPPPAPDDGATPYEMDDLPAAPAAASAAPSPAAPATPAPTAPTAPGTPATPAKSPFAATSQLPEFNAKAYAASMTASGFGAEVPRRLQEIAASRIEQIKAQDAEQAQTNQEGMQKLYADFQGDTNKMIQHAADPGYNVTPAYIAQFQAGLDKHQAELLKNKMDQNKLDGDSADYMKGALIRFADQPRKVQEEDGRWKDFLLQAHLSGKMPDSDYLYAQKTFPTLPDADTLQSYISHYGAASVQAKSASETQAAVLAEAKANDATRASLSAELKSAATPAQYSKILEADDTGASAFAPPVEKVFNMKTGEKLPGGADAVVGMGLSSEQYSTAAQKRANDMMTQQKLANQLRHQQVLEDQGQQRLDKETKLTQDAADTALASKYLLRNGNDPAKAIAALANPDPGDESRVATVTKLITGLKGGGLKNDLTQAQIDKNKAAADKADLASPVDAVNWVGMQRKLDPNTKVTIADAPKKKSEIYGTKPGASVKPATAKPVIPAATTPALQRKYNAAGTQYVEWNGKSWSAPKSAVPNQ